MNVSRFEKVWSSVEEQSGCSHMAVSRCLHQSILSTPIPLSHVGPTLQKSIDEPHAASHSRSDDSRRARRHMPTIDIDKIPLQPLFEPVRVLVQEFEGLLLVWPRAELQKVPVRHPTQLSPIYTFPDTFWLLVVPGASSVTPPKLPFLCFSAPSPNRATKQSTQPIANLEEVF